MSDSNKMYPLSKDEEKGLLYGSLIAAGIAAMSGENIASGIQNAIGGFGIAYSGGLASLLKQKEDELKAWREQEQLKLQQMSTESTVGYQQALKQRVEQEISEAERQKMIREDLARLFEQQGRPDLAKTVLTEEPSKAYEQLRAEKTPWALPMAGPQGQPVYRSPGGYVYPAYVDTSQELQNITKFNETRLKIYEESEKAALSYAKNILGENNPAIQLIEGRLPEGKKVSPEQWAEFKREYFQALKLSLAAKRVIAPDLVPEDLDKFLGQTAPLWLGPWETLVEMMNKEEGAGKPITTPEEQAKEIFRKKKEAETTTEPEKKEKSGFRDLFKYIAQNHPITFTAKTMQSMAPATTVKEAPLYQNIEQRIKNIKKEMENIEKKYNWYQARTESFTEADRKRYYKLKEELKNLESLKRQSFDYLKNRTR